MKVTWLDTVLLVRLRNAVDALLRDEQAGSRHGRSYTEQIFTLRNIIKQCVKFQHPLVVNFIDFEKAFNTVHHDSLWQIFLVYDIPQQFVNVFKNIYHNSKRHWNIRVLWRHYRCQARVYLVTHVVPACHRLCHAEDLKWKWMWYFMDRSDKG